MTPEITTILYATDLGTHTRPVFRHAILLAQKLGARIVVAHAMEPLGTTAKAIIETYLPECNYQQLHDQGFVKTRELMRSRIEKACEEELGTSAAESHLIEDIVVLEGVPSQVLYKEAQKRNAQLIVLGSHGHTRLGEFFIGSTARRLTQSSTIPVLLVPTEEG